MTDEQEVDPGTDTGGGEAGADLSRKGEVEADLGLGIGEDDCNDVSALTIRSVSGSVSGAGLSPSQYVKLNVGGSLHYTTIATLTKHDNMLRAMFSGRMEVLTDADGWILIGRN